MEHETTNKSPVTKLEEITELTKELIAKIKIFLPAATEESTKEFIDYVKSNTHTEVTKKEAEKLIELMNELVLISKNEQFIPDPEKYHNFIKLDNNIVVSPKPANQTNYSSVTNQTAVSKYGSALGLGRPGTIFLAHSGFYVTIKPPKDSELIVLESQLTSYVYRIGQETGGFVFDSNSGVIVKIIVEFILSNVIMSSLALTGDETLSDFIHILDIPLLMQGMLASMYPGGIRMKRNCNSAITTNSLGGICNVEVTGILNLMDIVFTDTSKFSDEDYKHLARKTANCYKSDDAQFKKYRERFFREKQVKFQIETAEIVVTLKMPVISKAIASADAYVETVMKQFNEIFITPDLGEAATKEIKHSKLAELINATILSKFNLYVEELQLTPTTDELSESGETLNNRCVDDDAIFEILGQLSNIDDESGLLAAFTREIDRLNAEELFSICAIPTYKCAACQKTATGEEDTDSYKLIPLNMLYYFLSLSTQRVGAYTKQKSLR
jgi:hypothetical protein